MSEVRRLPQTDPAGARAAIEAGATVVDVREPNEWEAGRIAGSLHVPLGELSDRVDEIPRERPVVVVCRSGGRSALATEALLGAGLDATNLDGGLQAWDAAGQPLDPPDGHVA